MNLVILLLVIFLNACAYTGEVSRFWGDLYIADSCRRCPMCCTSSGTTFLDSCISKRIKDGDDLSDAESNCAAFLDERDACLEENADMSDQQIVDLCFNQFP